MGTEDKTDRRSFLRNSVGAGSNLEGHHLRGYTLGDEWVYENPLAPARLFDDEIAVGACLLKMKRYVDTGEEFYPLAEGCQDHYLSMLIDEAAESGSAVTATQRAWST